jgi:hypothetical protein
MAYPTLDTTLPSRRWKLPPVWTNFALNLQGGGNKMFRWDQGPMPAVLSNVSINPMGAGGPYAVVGDGSPAVTQLNLTFVEVDVAVSDENHDYLMPLSSALVRSSTNPIPKRLIRDDV